MVRGKQRFSSKDTVESISKRVFDQNCQHQSSFCQSLTVPTKCRIGGSCGLFQNHQVNQLAAPHSRSVVQTVSMAQNRSVALAAALKILNDMDVVSRHKITLTLLYLLIHTHASTHLITPPGRCY